VFINNQPCGIAARTALGLALSAFAGFAIAQSETPQEAPPAANSDSQNPSANEVNSLVSGLQDDTASAAATPPAASETPAATATTSSDTNAPLQTIPVAEPAPERKPRAGIEEIVVTATKREENLRDIPASIAQFTGDKLEASGKTNLADYLSETPGVTMNQVTPNLPRISIRGISTDTSGLSGQPSPTGIFIGDVAFTDPYISAMQPDLSAFDLASVEVLKGPQGTLFGGAALAGALRYVLNDPQAGEWHVRGFSQYRVPDQGSAAATTGISVNAPLYEDKLTARLAYVNQKYPGVTDLTRDPVQYNVDHGSGAQYRGTLLWQPLDELKLKLTHLQQTYETPNANPYADNPKTRSNGNLILPEPVETKFSLDTLSAEYEFDDMRLVSLTSYSKKHLAVGADATPGLIGTPPAGYPTEGAAYLFIGDDSKAFTQELRLQSNGDGDFKWLTGAYLYKYSVHFLLYGNLLAEQDTLGPGSALANVLNGGGLDTTDIYNKTTLLYAVSDVKAQEYALFFDLSDRFWDQLEVSAGARLYSNGMQGGFFGTGVLAYSGNSGQEINYTGNKLRETGISPKVSATYKFSEDISQYLQISRGFRFGGLQSVPSTVFTTVPQKYKSDTLWNFETGLRTAWFDNSLHADVTVFYDLFKNPQIRQATGGPLSLTYTDNVGGAISRGLESSLQWLTPLPGLEVNLSAALTDAHTTESFTASDGSTVPAGQQLPGASKMQYFGGLTYLIPLNTFLLGPSVSYNYVGKGRSDIINSIPINDYGTLSAGLSLATQIGDYKPMLTFNASNIMNNTVVVGGGTSKVTATQMMKTNYTLNAPRTFTMRFSMDF
jgi:outer membrane receptor protein involved in Fe transport